MRFFAVLLAFLTRLRRPALDLLERVGATWLQAFVAALVITGGLDVGAVSAAALAGITAGLNLILRLATAWVPTVKDARIELAQRVLITFVAGFVAALLAAGHYGLSDLRGAAVAGVAAALVVVKAGVAKLLGSTSASLLDIRQTSAASASPPA